MSIKEQVVQKLNDLSEAELEQVAEYMAFLKFRSRIHLALIPDETQLASLYAEFARENSALAVEGFSDYLEGLKKEDAQ